MHRIVRSVNGHGSAGNHHRRSGFDSFLADGTGFVRRFFCRAHSGHFKAFRMRSPIGSAAGGNRNGSAFNLQRCLRLNAVFFCFHGNRAAFNPDISFFCIFILIRLDSVPTRRNRNSCIADRHRILSFDSIVYRCHRNGTAGNFEVVLALNPVIKIGIHRKCALAINRQVVFAENGCVRLLCLCIGIYVCLTICQNIFTAGCQR